MKVSVAVSKLNEGQTINLVSVDKTIEMAVTKKQGYYHVDLYSKSSDFSVISHFFMNRDFMNREIADMDVIIQFNSDFSLLDKVKTICELGGYDVSECNVSSSYDKTYVISKKDFHFNLMFDICMDGDEMIWRSFEFCGFSFFDDMSYDMKKEFSQVEAVMKEIEKHIDVLPF